MGHTSGGDQQDMNLCGPNIIFLLNLFSIIISQSFSAHVRPPVYESMLLQSHSQSYPTYPVRTNFEKVVDKDDHGEYEDFPQEPVYLQASYSVPNFPNDLGKQNSDIFKSPSKRYLGIEIPDYVSSPNKGTILKTIQNRMMAAKMNFGCLTKWRLMTDRNNLIKKMCLLRGGN